MEEFYEKRTMHETPSPNMDARNEPDIDEYIKGTENQLEAFEHKLENPEQKRSFSQNANDLINEIRSSLSILKQGNTAETQRFKKVINESLQLLNDTIGKAAEEGADKTDKILKMCRETVDQTSSMFIEKNKEYRKSIELLLGKFNESMQEEKRKLLEKYDQINPEIEERITGLQKKTDTVKNKLNEIESIGKGSWNAFKKKITEDILGIEKDYKKSVTRIRNMK